MPRTFVGETPTWKIVSQSLLETPVGGLIVTGTEVPANYRGATAFVLHVAADDLGRANLK